MLHVLLLAIWCKTLENTEGAIKKGQSRETDNIDEDEDKQSKTTTQYVLNTNYAQTNTNKVNKTFVLLHKTGGKDESHIVFMRK